MKLTPEKILFRLGLKKLLPSNWTKQTSTITLFDREQTVRALKEEFGMWLNKYPFHVGWILDEHDLPLVPNIRTLYWFHTPGDSTSLMNSRSLLNRISRMKSKQPDFYIIPIHIAPVTLQTILTDKEHISAGVAVLIENGHVIAQLNDRREFEQFRQLVQNEI